VTISILPPVKLAIDPDAARQGAAQRRRRGAAGRHDRRHGEDRDARPDPVRGGRHAYRDRDTGKPIIEDALGTSPIAS
jgi:acyl-[acyl-carrier-protein]-phospholipid O-acyltransferase/long-chain-fatty-acid--[acyl-carrier-protein] ligase